MTSEYEVKGKTIAPDDIGEALDAPLSHKLDKLMSVAEKLRVPIGSHKVIP